MSACRFGNGVRRVARTPAGALVCALAALGSINCSRAAKPGVSELGAGIAIDDSGRDRAGVESRCRFKEGSNREVRETAGPGAVLPSIRRVYAIEPGEGREEPSRILLCREVDTNYDGMKDVVRIYSERGVPESESADSDFDGKMDTWMTFSRGRVTKTEVDTNRDGRPDEVRFYIRGRLRRLQRDTNFDGKEDVWEIYDEGRLQRLGEDLDFDGHVDRWNRDEVAVRHAEEGDSSDEEEAEKEAPPTTQSSSHDGK